ncbi:MAG: putative manganese-dependent inorganic diphosphatase [Lentisphaeria bacterium]|nr:putative manganese-dependent inorganic diphosphatase [Lentisphaeria bacterium]
MNRKIFVTGHRNPDVDSLASAVALAELRRRQGMKNVSAVSPGVPPERAKWLFRRFNQPLPATRNDLHLRVCDIMESEIAVVPAGTPLYLAVKMLQKSGSPRLPVVREGRYLGMLSPMALLARWLSADAGGSLTGRRVHSSVRLIARVIDAKMPRCPAPDELVDFSVYVAAMGVDSFEEHLPQGGKENLIVIVGDRPEIHLRALQCGVKMLIVTGDRPVEKLILDEAERRHVVILRTACDSATVIRRLKLCTPAELSGVADTELFLSSRDRIRDVKQRILSSPEDAVPVVDGDAFAGVVMKKSVTAEPPFSVILVDHNEPEQSIPGVSELPVIEVVDHHRMGMMPTREPIKFTGDAVGSTCTLVAAMYRSSGESLTPELAGLLEGGIVTDTLNLRSPTSSPLDRRMMEWLEKISGVRGGDLMEALSGIDSPLAVSPAEEVISSDRKDYAEKNLKFAVSQVEESKLSLLDRRRDELVSAMNGKIEKEKLDFFCLMVTDAVRGNSKLLFCGDGRVSALLPYDADASGVFFMPGVVSRKKQLLPQLTAIVSTVTGE